MQMFDRVKAENTKIAKHKNSRKKSWFFIAAVAGLITFAFAVLPVRYDHVITYDIGASRMNANRSVNDIKTDFNKILSEANSKWLKKLAEMEEEIQDIVNRRTDAMYSKWISDERLVSFVDEYYGYFKGWKFLCLSVKDLLSEGSDKEALCGEVSRMIKRNLLFDFNSDMDSLFVELEGYIADNTGQFMKKLFNNLDEMFSKEELERLEKGFKVGDIDVTPSELQSLIRTGVDFTVTEMIINAIFARIAPEVASRAFAKSGNRMLVHIGSKVASALTSTILGKLITGLGIGIIVDYLLVKVCKVAGRQELENSLVTGMRDFRSSLTDDINRRLEYAFRDLAGQSLFH